MLSFEYIGHSVSACICSRNLGPVLLHHSMREYSCPLLPSVTPWCYHQLIDLNLSSALDAMANCRVRLQSSTTTGIEFGPGSPCDIFDGARAAWRVGACQVWNYPIPILSLKVSTPLGRGSLRMGFFGPVGVLFPPDSVTLTVGCGIDWGLQTLEASRGDHLGTTGSGRSSWVVPRCIRAHLLCDVS